MFFNHQKPSPKSTSDSDCSSSSRINQWQLPSGDPSLFSPLVCPILKRVIALLKFAGLQIFKAVITLSIITQNAPCQTQEPSTEEIVTAFKQFLENPPIIEEMVFDRIQIDPAPDWEGPLQEIFQIRHQTGDYFFRKLKSVEDADNKNLDGEMFMASRFQTNCWTFSYGIFEHAVGNYGDELNLEVPISFTMYTAKMMMFEGMHFGMGHIKPYSIR
ncbi:MAG TPA: hypothetical protein EYQ50_06420, partial [Verrucomicrobiales bacterium]|nr:hypothetical protein [Verrucomicrobiales bacterium]